MKRPFYAALAYDPSPKNARKALYPCQCQIRVNFLAKLEKGASKASGIMGYHQCCVAVTIVPVRRRMEVSVWFSGQESSAKLKALCKHS